MRYRELLETSPVALGIYNPNNDALAHRANSSGQRPKITLAYLNRLKHIQKRRKAELDAKAQFLPIMYGDAAQQYETEKMELERQQHEISMMIDKLETELAKAEVSEQDRERIHQMAMAEIHRIQKP